MNIISKFENFSYYKDNIDNIKDIFLDLKDKWNIIQYDGHSSNNITYSIWIDGFLKSFMNLLKLPKISIDDKDNVFLIISIKLSGKMDFYTTLYAFNKDCEELLKRFKSEYDCELITSYGNPYLQSKGIPTSEFLFVFRNNI